MVFKVLLLKGGGPEGAAGAPGGAIHKLGAPPGFVWKLLLSKGLETGIPGFVWGLLLSKGLENRHPGFVWELVLSKKLGNWHPGFYLGIAPKQRAGNRAHLVLFGNCFLARGWNREVLFRFCLLRIGTRRRQLEDQEGQFPSWGHLRCLFGNC